MRKPLISIGALALAVTACSGPQDMEAELAADIAEASSAPVDADTGSSQDENSIEADAAVAAPQIAYRYALGFRLPAAAIKPLQERHGDLCEARGPSQCRIISMDQSDTDGDYAYGTLQIAVAADNARKFAKELEASSGSVDGTLVSSSIAGEDLSKQIIDTQATLRARTLLRDRLMDILRERKGTVAELVEAERSVAQVNQEIDQAQSWLNEMRGRVAFSQMTISYESGSRISGGFGEPVRDAWNSLGSILGAVIAFLMMAFTALVPIGLVAFGGFKLWRWIKPKPQKPGDTAATASGDAP